MKEDISNLPNKFYQMIRSDLRKTTTLILITLLTLNFGCNSQATKGKATLSSLERHYCDSLKIDSSIIIQLRQFTSSAVEPFHYSLSKEFHPDGTETELDPIHLQGFVFKETTENTELILEKLRSNFEAKGYSIFILEQNFGIRNQPDVMGILKTTDKYEVLREIKTNGVNYDIDPDSLVNIIKVFDAKYSLDLVGASGDWCEFIINKEPNDWMVFAQEAYKVCPDIVDQGTGTVEALADEMKKSRRLYFWWD